MPSDIDPLILAVKSYEQLIGKDFIITLETGYEINIKFKKNNFYHLIGFQYLKDITQLDPNKNKKNTIFNNIKKGSITYEMIKSSNFFNEDLEKRIVNFHKIDKLLFEKVIVDFDKTKLPFNSDLKAHYILFQNDSSFFMHLCLGHDKNYYPESFFVRDNKDYIENQETFRIKSIRENKQSNSSKNKKQKNADVI